MMRVARSPLELAWTVWRALRAYDAEKQLQEHPNRRVFLLREVESRRTCEYGKSWW